MEPVIVLSSEIVWPHLKLDEASFITQKENNHETKIEKICTYFRLHISTHNHPFVLLKPLV